MLDLEQLLTDQTRPPSMGVRLQRAMNVLRYYRTSQIARRAWQTVWPETRRVVLREGSPCGLRKDALHRWRTIAATRDVRTAVPLAELHDDLMRGVLTLLGQSCALGQPIDWHETTHPHPSRLWGFQLHYHDYLLDLAVGADMLDRDPWPAIWETVRSWIAACPDDEAMGADAWHPYCISRRLPVWIQLWAMASPPEDLADVLPVSIATQAESLATRLEHDLGGNHLLENLHGLVAAGTVVDGRQSDEWLTLAEAQLRRQLEEQLLPWGEHFERSPMYHGQVAGNLLAAAWACEPVRPGLAAWCREKAEAMITFLRQLLHPDGEIPLLGDSCFGESYGQAELERLALLGSGRDLADATPPRPGSTVVGPYWVWREDANRAAIVFDAGPAGADPLPAHAHCDLLGFEASVAGTRWLVDSGLYDYEISPMRRYCRSSAAHNVVTIGLEDSCDVWSRFRMGRRARPGPLRHGDDGPYSWASCSHDGYRHLGVASVSRLLVAHRSAGWACIDWVSHPAEEPPVGRLHLAPGLEVEQTGPRELLLRRGDTCRRLSFVEGVAIDWALGWYCDRFGRRQRTQVVCYRPTAPRARPALGWQMTAAEDQGTRLTIPLGTDELVRWYVAEEAEPFAWHPSVTRPPEGRAAS